MFNSRKEYRNGFLKNFICTLLLLSSFNLLLGESVILKRVCAGSDKSITISWLKFKDTCTSIKRINIYIKKTPSPTDKFNLYTSIFQTNITEYRITSAVPLYIPSYFKIEYVVSCGSAIDSFISDSQQVDLIKPIPIQPDSVSVSGNNIEIGWHEEGSKDIYGYVIYRDLGTLTQAIDTIIGNNNTFYKTKKPFNTNDSSYNFRLAALDSCKNVGPALVAHSSIVLAVNIDTCKRVFTLNWTTYKGWFGGVASYKIYYRVDSGEFKLLKQLNGSFNNTQCSNVKFNTSITFYIRAIANDGYTSSSNFVMCIPGYISSPKQIFIKNTVNLDSLIKIHIDLPTFSYKKIICSMGNSKSGLKEVGEVQHLTIVLNGQFSDKFIQITALDQCDNICGQSIVFKPLSAKLKPIVSGLNEITWSKVDFLRSGVSSYVIWRSESYSGKINREFLVELDSSVNSYKDNFNYLNQKSNSGFCYEIVAIPILVSDSFSTSQVVCSVDSPRVYFPSGFLKNGCSGNFKPLYSSIDTSKSSYKIYNRWGEMIFSGSIYEEFNFSVSNDNKYHYSNEYFYICEAVGLDRTKHIISGKVILLN